MIGWHESAMPHIQWNHIDGPLLHMRTGELHWLTVSERVAFFFKQTDAIELERKHSTLLIRAAPGHRKGWMYASTDDAAVEPNV